MWKARLGWLDTEVNSKVSVTVLCDGTKLLYILAYNKPLGGSLTLDGFNTGGYQVRCVRP
jgi:hypothetical protein